MTAPDPLLLDEPALQTAMARGGFILGDQPGTWRSRLRVGGAQIPVDLLVPDAAVPQVGRRGARLGPHGKRAAHRAVGLEAALVDHAPMTILALDAGDDRREEAKVAGVAALLMAKAHKLRDRLSTGTGDRAEDKDAADVFRLMRDSSPQRVAETLTALAEHPLAGPSVQVGVGYLISDFSRRGAGIAMASRSLRLAVPEARVETVCIAYTRALADALALD